MRQHKYCMHSIKKIGACRKRKKKKSLSAGDLRSPGPAATGNRCVHHLREPRSRPPSCLSAAPCRLSGWRGGFSAGEGAGGGSGRGGGGGRPSLLLLDARVGALPLPSHAAFAESPQTGAGGGGVMMHAEGSGPREWKLESRF